MPNHLSSFICVLVILLSSIINPYKSQHHQHDTYDLDWTKDGVLLGTGIALTFLGDYFIGKADKASIVDIQNLDKNNLPKIDRGATNNFSSSAESLSDAILYAGIAAPFFVYAFDECRGDELETLIITAETFFFTHGTTQIIKAAAKRYRPYNYNPDVPIDFKLGKTSRRSFFSGHTSNTAAFSFMTARMLTDMHHHWDKRTKSIVWTSAALLPLVTGYGRYKAGKHFPTDVFTGYIIGAAIGITIPVIHRSKKIKIEPSLGSISLTYKLN